jgi:hypothetical protein
VVPVSFTKQPAFAHALLPWDAAELAASCGSLFSGESRSAQARRLQRECDDDPRPDSHRFATRGSRFIVACHEILEVEALIDLSLRQVAVKPTRTKPLARRTLP